MVPVRNFLAAAAVLFFLGTVGACSGGSPAPAGSRATPPAARAAALPATAPPTAAVPAAKTAAGGRAKPGWPVPSAAYLGRYTMTWSSDASFARSGFLTLFMRSITKPKAMVVPSGIVSVFGRDATTVLYLTKFGHLGSRAIPFHSSGGIAQRSRKARPTSRRRCSVLALLPPKPPTISLVVGLPIAARHSLDPKRRRLPARPRSLAAKAIDSLDPESEICHV